MPKEIFDFYDITTLKSYNLDKSMQYQLNILGSLDMFTRQHSENVASLVCRICQNLHCQKSFTEYCTICAYLHDIGKQFLPASIIQKRDNLTDEELEIVKKHAKIGYDICMNDLKLRPYAAGSLYHHESLDGTGYPNGLTKEDIPYEAQIIKVANEYDNLVSKKKYNSHINIIEILKILIDSCKPSTDESIPKKNRKYGKNNPIMVRALIKVVIDDIEYEISCIMDYLKDLKPEIKRLSQIEKYDKKRLSSKSDKKKTYYLNGMKLLMIDRETVDNYSEILNSYRNITEEKSQLVKDLFKEIKSIKKLKV